MHVNINLNWYVWSPEYCISFVSCATIFCFDCCRLVLGCCRLVLHFFLMCLKLLIVYACDTNVNTFCFFESWCNYSNFSWILARSPARKPSYKNSLKQEISPCRQARKFTFQALPAKAKVTLYIEDLSLTMWIIFCAGKIKVLKCIIR